MSSSTSSLLRVRNLKAAHPSHYWLFVDNQISEGQLGSAGSGNKAFAVRAVLVGDSNRITRSHPEVTRFAAKVDEYHQAVWINDGIFVDHVRGQRVGTYCMNALVTWITENAPPHHAVNFPKLGGDLNIVNIERRNKLYGHFGFDFVWENINGIEKAGGVAKPLTVANLTPYQNWPNIMQYDLPDGLADLVSENQQLANQCRDQAQTIKMLSKESREQADSMFRWLRQIELYSTILAFVLGAVIGHWW
jgi:hypothetical protein